MNRVSLALIGFTVVGALSIAGCGSDTTPQPTVTVTAPATTVLPGSPPPPTTPAPPTRPTDAQVYAQWVQAGGLAAVNKVLDELNQATNVSSCSALLPLAQQIVADAQHVIDFAPAPPGALATPLNAAMEHAQNSVKAETTYCQSTPGSAAEAAAQAQANAELKASRAELAKAEVQANLYQNTSGVV